MEIDQEAARDLDGMELGGWRRPRRPDWLQKGTLTRTRPQSG